ncbi:hypothetical protein DNTS_022655 [Danionella cerebrum]|uniref:polypeptide N-acetylgalactosaminyltransferase n=1 Tax=Danionella cerebrum TaxID=2873325 RepID=A0A553NGF6_9TELE|nr:hypothetical protein DNTS_022655 [Danionella translucida]
MRRRRRRLLLALLLLLLLGLTGIGIGLLLPGTGTGLLEQNLEPPAPGDGGKPEHRQNLIEQNNPVGKRDWHDFKAIHRDAARQGPGEQGQAMPVSAADRADQFYRDNGFNILISDRIALNRSLPDIRHPRCMQKLYSQNLPSTSIIIPFHNEGWSTLLRTVHKHLKGPLERYVAQFPKVRVLRTQKREDRIALNRKTIVCPMIDVINHDDFHYESQAGDAMRGAFDWEMNYKRLAIPVELANSDDSEPFLSPVMAGGLFAVDRMWFWELGGYDAGLEIWGGEQYEISFKVWMCGGRMEDVPCSRVGHIYRKFVPYKVPGGVSLARNLKRVAEVWMDEYAEYLYQRRPVMRHLPAGDLSAQRSLRERLGCRNFRWFMSSVAPDLPLHYPPVEPDPAAWGELRNVGSGLCVESKHFTSGSPITLEKCRRGSYAQVFTFGWREDIRVGDPLHTKKVCLDAVSHNSPVTLYDCHGMKGNQRWVYRSDQHIHHPVTNSCMDYGSGQIFMSSCDSSSPSQLWVFQNINNTVLNSFNKHF